MLKVHSSKAIKGLVLEAIYGKTKGFGPKGFP